MCVCARARVCVCAPRYEPWWKGKGGKDKNGKGGKDGKGKGRGSFWWLRCFIFVAYNFVANEVVALIEPQNNEKMFVCG